jgi:hypothetical protein
LSIERKEMDCWVKGKQVMRKMCHVLCGRRIWTTMRKA